ncbi:GNAT family N-acetyltransferase [Micromonosporaceae bacterium Da 78-11]
MTALPEGWTTRRPTLDDVPAILELVHASDIAAVGEPDFTADEVREMLTEPHTDLARDCWLALDAEGAIVGWAYPHNPTGGDRDFIEVYVWPERGLPAQRPLLDLIMERMAGRAAELGHEAYQVRAGAIPTEKPYVQALLDAGFVFVKQHARMQMSLAAVPHTDPEPPAGVLVRPVRAGDEAEMRRFHAVIEQAFRDSDHHSTGYDDWRRQVDAEPVLSFDEWFVAEIDGVIAGVLQSSDSGAEADEGWVKRLAVLRAYRKRGLGETLLRRAFATYARKGRAKVGLGVDMANPTRAARLYLAAGMTPRYQADIFQTEVRARRA